MTDERPKPKYGELAPEGWVWKPPAAPSPDSTTPDAGEPNSPTPVPPPASGRGSDRASWPAPSAPPQSPGGSEGTGPEGSPSAAPRPVLGGDLAITVILLVIGFLITASWVPFLLDLSGNIQTYLTQQDLGTYTADGVAQTVGVGGAVLQVVLLATATTLSVFRIRARRRAFYIPLIAGVLGIAITFACTAIALASDAALMESLTTVSGG